MLGVLLILALAGVGLNAQSGPDDEAIRRLIANRETAWNAGNREADARLLTADADNLSATGRMARGLTAIIELFVEQQADVYATAVTSTPINTIRFLRPDVAIADADFKLTGVRGSVPSAGRIVFVVVKQPDETWLIAAIRGILSR